MKKSQATKPDVELWEAFMRNGHMFKPGETKPKRGVFPYFDQQFADYQDTETEKNAALAFVNRWRAQAGEPLLERGLRGTMPAGIGPALFELRAAGRELHGNSYAKVRADQSAPKKVASKKETRNSAAESHAKIVRHQEVTDAIAAAAKAAGMSTRYSTHDRPHLLGASNFAFKFGLQDLGTYGDRLFQNGAQTSAAVQTWEGAGLDVNISSSGAVLNKLDLTKKARDAVVGKIGWANNARVRADEHTNVVSAALKNGIQVEVGSDGRARGMHRAVTQLGTRGLPDNRFSREVLAEVSARAAKRDETVGKRAAEYNEYVSKFGGVGVLTPSQVDELEDFIASKPWSWLGGLSLDEYMFHLLARLYVGSTFRTIREEGWGFLAKRTPKELAGEPGHLPALTWIGGDIITRHEVCVHVMAGC